MAPVRIGIVGSGAIAQVHHLPNLMVLQNEFSVETLCDLSPTLVRKVGERFHVPNCVTDYRDLLASDIDAVLICCADPKTEIACASFEAGYHVFVEKPFCFTLDDADDIIAAAIASGQVGQIGYMKVFDPAFDLVEQEVRTMDDIRYIQVNHLHTNNSHHLQHFNLERATDVPDTVARGTELLRRAGIEATFGDIPAEAETAFYIVAGSLVHDLYGLRHLFGPPQEFSVPRSGVEDTVSPRSSSTGWEPAVWRPGLSCLTSANSKRHSKSIPASAGFHSRNPLALRAGCSPKCTSTVLTTVGVPSPMNLRLSGRARFRGSCVISTNA